MGAAILKGGGLAAVLAGGAFALFQANAAVEGSLAAAATPAPVPEPIPEPAPEPQGEWGDAPADFGEADPFAADPFLEEPAADPAPAEPFAEALGEDYGDPFGAVLRTLPSSPATAPADDDWTDQNWADEPAPPVAGAEEPPALDDWADDSAAPAEEDAAWLNEPPRDPLPGAAADPFGIEPEPAPLVRDAFSERTAPGADAPGSPDGRSFAADFADDRPAAAEARLRVSKDAPPTAEPGVPFVYTVTVANPGSGSARGVVVEEPIPAGVELVGTNPRVDRAGDTLLWELGELPAGGERTLSVQVEPTAAGTVGSVTVVRCDLSAAARTKVLAPRLALDAAPAGPVRAGRPFDLRLTVRNAGTAPTAAAAVRCLLPDGVAHASGERDLEYDLGKLRAGEAREVALTLVAAAPGPLELDCELVTTGDATVAPARAVAAFDVRDRQLALTRTGPRTRFVGRVGSYVNVVTNRSDLPAPPVRVVEVIPAGFKFDRSPDGRFDPNTRQVTWEVPALPPGRSAELSVDLLAERTGPAETRVRLEADGTAESELVSAVEVRGYTAVAPRVRGLNGPLAVGERVALIVTLENTGTEPATGLFADLTLPPQVFAGGYRGEGLTAEETDRGLRLSPSAPLAAGETLTAEVMIEAAAVGSGTIELSVSADHLPEPARRGEPVRVYADTE